MRRPALNRDQQHPDNRIADIKVTPATHSTSPSREVIPASPRRLRSRMVVVLVRAAWGLLLVMWPRTVLSLLNAPKEDRAGWIARTLGARHLAQAGLQWREPQRLPLCALVDGIHALTMGVLAASDQRWRRPASIDAVAASMFGLATLAAAGDGRQGGEGR